MQHDLLVVFCSTEAHIAWLEILIVVCQHFPLSAFTWHCVSAPASCVPYARPGEDTVCLPIFSSLSLSCFHLYLILFHLSFSGLIFYFLSSFLPTFCLLSPPLPYSFFCSPAFLTPHSLPPPTTLTHVLLLFLKR